MKRELFFHLLPVTIIFFIISFIWIIFGTPNIYIFYLLIGLFLGTFFLDIDHIIYWFYRKPNTNESRIVQMTFEKKDYKSVYKLIRIARKTHNNLIFHHYFFQIILILISFFIFTSSTNIFIKSFLFALNLHLLVDEIFDFYTDKKALQKWLFAREDKQLSVDSLKYYILTFIILLVFFGLLLLKSKP